MDERLIDGRAPKMQGRLHRAGNRGSALKQREMLLSRLFRRHPTPPAPPAPPVLDRSTLLAELEVAVPAPERLVRWDTATRPCPDCAENVARSAGSCRHCGYALV